MSYLFVSTRDAIPRAEPLATNLDTVAFVDGARSVCGGIISASGAVRLALEFADGGGYRADAGGNCQTFNGGWWATTIRLRPVRGYQSSPAEVLTSASPPPYLAPFDIDGVGNVLVDASGAGVPFGKVLPSGQELRGVDGRAAYVYRFGSPGVVFGTTADDEGHNRVAKWSDGGLRFLPSPLAATDVVINAVGADDRACATLLGADGQHLVLWNESEQVVDFAALDAGTPIVACNQLLDDGWIAVGLSVDGGLLSPGLVRVTWSCGP